MSSARGTRGYDITYFTASTDTPEYNKEFSDSLTLDFPILSDPDKSVAKSYGVVHDQRLVPGVGRSTSARMARFCTSTRK